ncbi:MAG TPA: ribosome small subunit-dependent GTPase A [Vicinamibacterales bacterium]|nr:ribosome small subunit-dependent GTPase A [Vicinamibacterales bacterium]
MTDLTALGWTDVLAAQFAPDRAAGLVPGRVSLEHNHVYRVLAADREWLAEVAGRVKYRATGRHELPAVGDWVALRLDPAGGRAVIREVLPRTSWFSRKVAGKETEEQVVAANIDTVLLVFGLDRPVKARRIERFLVPARRSGATPVIVLNKADVCEDELAAVGEAASAAPDVQVLVASARDGRGLDALRGLLKAGKTIALLGPSGAGKSSIVNYLAGHEVLATGDVRESDARGRHTSVHRQMVVLDAGGVIIDTPGMRELQLWDVDEAVDETFADIASLAAACRFRDCRHDREPGCAVKHAVDTGALDEGRYQSFLKLSRERQAFDKLRDERAQLEAKRQAKVMGRAQKKMQKDRER